jgi:hypothetical protein
MTLNQQLEHIAKTILGINSLVAQNTDEKDFHTIAVWKLKHALEDAYLAGKRSQYKSML